MFGRNLENHVHVIGTGCSFQYLHFLLFCQLSDDLADLNPDESVEFVLPILWYNDHVVFAVPHHMAL